MGETTETKKCPFCAETIKAAAKICPFCGSKLSRHALLKQRLLVLLPGAALIIVAAVVIESILPSEEGVGGRSFAGHQKDLVVLNTTFEREPARKSDFWMTGVVTNRGAYPWRVHELEVRFLDKRGDLLDVLHPDVKSLFVVQPHHEHGFRVGLGTLEFTNGVIRRQVRVQFATDGDRPAKPE